MRRAAGAFLATVRRRGPAWPLGLGLKLLSCRLAGLPRGLVIEPSESCTGGCTGCVLPANPAELSTHVLERWLETRPVPHATIHFAGRHSDPLASVSLAELVHLARRHSSMVSISTVALGMTPRLAALPVDRWLFSLPAATSGSWIAVKGVDRLGEAVDAIRMVSRGGSGAMFEVIFTRWGGSAGDGAAFAELARLEGWKNTRTVHALHDPSGSGYRSTAALALDDPDCPYRLGAGGSIELKRTGAPCPQAGYLCLDARGGLRPCPFAGSDAPSLMVPSREAWETAAGWKACKRLRPYDNCRICP